MAVARDFLGSHVLLYSQNNLCVYIIFLPTIRLLQYPHDFIGVFLSSLAEQIESNFNQILWQYRTYTIIGT